MIRVSIITPSYNQAAFLRQTMESVLGQDYPAVEYLVVDGGSTDGSPELINAYADRLAWWVSEADAGQGEAINKGLAHCSGEVVAWLNSDDYYLPGAIRAAVGVFDAHPEVVMVYGNVRAVDENGAVINNLTYDQRSLENLLCFQIIGQPAVFLRANAVKKVGGLDPRFHFLLDHQLWIRLAAIGPVLHVDETWAAARYHAGAKNRRLAAEFGREAFEVLSWAEGEPSLVPRLRKIKGPALASAHRLNARYLLDAGRPREALGAWMRALAIHPRTALARMNILGSAILEVLGLGAIRESVLRRRKKGFAP